MSKSGTFVPSRWSGVDVYGDSMIHLPSGATLNLTTTKQSLPNEPTSAEHIANMALLKDFLAKIPFKIEINSGFRTPAVNSRVGGSGNSQHMTGLGVDILPIDPELGELKAGGANRALAAWFYQHRAEFPELDQVIWYMTTRHTHVGICPVGATGCQSPAQPGKGRQQFKTKFAHGYEWWSPSLTEATKWAKKYPMRVGVAGGILLLGALSTAAIAITLAWKYTRS